jgi:NitT/TauT family transport system substrate-binding protein
MQNPLIKFELAPQRLLPFAQFMNDIKILKNRPQSWKELFFENIHNLNGS